MYYLQVVRSSVVWRAISLYYGFCFWFGYVLATVDLRLGEPWVDRMPAIRFHSLCAYVLLTGGLRELTGHKSEAMTDRYDHAELVDRLKLLQPHRETIDTFWD